MMYVNGMFKRLMDQYTRDVNIRNHSLSKELIQSYIFPIAPVGVELNDCTCKMKTIV